MRKWGSADGVACLAVLAGLSAPAWAQAEGEAPQGDAEKSVWERDTLTGDWGGWRASLADAGVTPSLRYTGEMFGNPSGGIRQGIVYEQQLLAAVDVDFGKMADLTGLTGHASGLSVNDRGPSGRDIGNALDVSSVEWKSQTRLWTAWLQQTACDQRISLRIGQLSSDDEFDVSTTAANLLNSTFGSNASVFANLPAGRPNDQNLTLGPAYPLGAPGIRLQVSPNDNWAWLTAVFSHFPASPDRNGLQFNLGGGELVMSELQYLENQGKDATGLPAAYKLGGWYDSGKFNDQRVDGAGQSLAPGGNPRQDSGDYSLYALADQTLWQSKDGQALSVFVRINLVPQGDRNLVTFYIDGGAGYKGVIPDRPADVLGFGFAYAGVGGGARDFDRANGLAERSGEAAIEVNYTAAVAPWWTVTPDLQYIINPAYGGTNPLAANPRQTIPDAFVIGLRTTLQF